MHRFIRRTVAAAALVVTAAPVSAQVVFDAPPGSGGVFGGNRGGIGQIMQVGTATTVTRLGFRLGVLQNFPGTQNFTAYIATFAAPTTRLWQQSFTRALAGNPQEIPVLVLTDPFSLQLAAGTQYFIGFYSTGGSAGYAWIGSGTTPISQNGFTQVAVRELNVDGNIVPRQFEYDWQQSIRIEGTPTVTPPPPPPGVVPEPSTYALMATGLAGLAALRRRRAAATA